MEKAKYTNRQLLKFQISDLISDIRFSNKKHPENMPDNEKEYCKECRDQVFKLFINRHGNVNKDRYGYFTAQRRNKAMQAIPITDHTFRDLSDIRHLCPCGLDIKTCKREDTGEVFQIGRILTGTAKGTCLYPAGNEFAKMTCEVVFK